jgi:hypothetical protein
MTKSQYTATQNKLTENKTNLALLLRKRENLDLTIANLENKIRNQEAILKNVKIEDLKEDLPVKEKADQPVVENN